MQRCLVADDRTELMRMIATVLDGHCTVATFQERFLAYYHSDVPLDLSFDDREAALFSAIAERLDYSRDNLDTESRSLGYVTHDDTLAWLRQLMQQFARTTDLDAHDPA